MKNEPITKPLAVSNRIMISVPPDLREQIRKRKDINWSAVFRNAAREILEREAKRR